MSGYRRVNYYELCRLCTSSEGSKVHIFREEGKRRQLLTKIQLCLPLQVTEEDSLPKILCSNCIEKLESFFDFRSSCVNAEAMLESYFSSLRYNNNESVYVKEITLNKTQESDTSISEVSEGTQLQTQEITVEIPTTSQVKVSPSNTPAVTTVPVTLDSLSSLVQAAAIQFVGQNEAGKLLDSRLQQYKCALQIQQTSPTAVQATVSSSSDNRFQTFQTISKAAQSTQTFCEEKETKSDSQQPRIEESSEGRDSPVVSEASLQPTIAFSSTGTGQDVLVHFGFNKDKEVVSPTSVFQTNDSVSRNPVVQIGEFLRMKEMEECIEEVEVECFTCENCGKEVSEEERSEHALTCGESTLNQSAIDDKSNGTTYLCDICTKPFKRKEHLFQHKKLHTGERPFLCGRCGKAFSRKEHLVRHSVSHTGQKQYSCDVCGKSFGRKDNVRKHRKTHGLSGPFACETCGKTFMVKPYYLMHKATQCKPTTGSGGGTTEDTSQLPYVCDICHKGFAVKQYLASHKLRHRGKSPQNPPTTEEGDERRESRRTEDQLDVAASMLQQGQVFQVSSSDNTSATTYICTTAASTDQLLETYRKLSTT